MSFPPRPGRWFPDSSFPRSSHTDTSLAPPGISDGFPFFLGCGSASVLFFERPPMRAVPVNPPPSIPLAPSLFFSRYSPRAQYRLPFSSFFFFAHTGQKGSSFSSASILSVLYALPPCAFLSSLFAPWTSIFFSAIEQIQPFCFALQTYFRRAIRHLPSYAPRSQGTDGDAHSGF